MNASRILFPIMTLALLGCASTPNPQVAQTSTAGRAPTVLVTGSRIPVAVNPQTGLPRPDPTLQTVSNQDILQTGRVSDVGAALRELVPVVH